MSSGSSMVSSVVSVSSVPLRPAGCVTGRASSQGGAYVVLPARVDASLAANVVRVAAGHALTAALGPMFGTLTIDVVAAGDGGAATASSREATPS